jgi:hypothetical protein
MLQSPGYKDVLFDPAESHPNLGQMLSENRYSSNEIDDAEGNISRISWESVPRRGGGTQAFAGHNSFSFLYRVAVIGSQIV